MTVDAAMIVLALSLRSETGSSETCVVWVPSKATATDSWLGSTISVVEDAVTVVAIARDHVVSSVVRRSTLRSNAGDAGHHNSDTST